MSNLADKIAHWHRPLDKGIFQALALVLGFAHVGLVMWDPQSYADSIGGFNAIIAPCLIWAICSSMVFGVGFKPIKWYWQLLFSPYFSIAILFTLSVLFIL